MRRNFSTVHERVSHAIAMELLRKDGHYPAVKDKVRTLLQGNGKMPYEEINELASAAAFAVLDCERLQVIARRRCGSTS